MQQRNQRARRKLPQRTRIRTQPQIHGHHEFPFFCFCLLFFLPTALCHLRSPISDLRSLLSVFCFLLFIHARIMPIPPLPSVDTPPDNVLETCSPTIHNSPFPSQICDLQSSPITNLCSLTLGQRDGLYRLVFPAGSNLPLFPDPPQNTTDMKNRKLPIGR